MQQKIWRDLLTPSLKTFLFIGLEIQKKLISSKKTPKTTIIHKLLFSYKAYLSSGSESFIYIVYFTILILFFFNNVM